DGETTPGGYSEAGTDDDATGARYAAGTRHCPAAAGSDRDADACRSAHPRTGARCICAYPHRYTNAERHDRAQGRAHRRSLAAAISREDRSEIAARRSALTRTKPERVFRSVWLAPSRGREHQASGE